MAISKERAVQLTQFLERYRLKMMANLHLLDTALTHSSYAFEMQLDHDNERLEFLGDSVLGLVVSHYLYQDFPRSREGILSKYKSQMISRGVLGKRAYDMGLGELILLGKGEELARGKGPPGTAWQCV